MKSYAQSAGYAEQALQSIKIVQTYGNEELELNNYCKYLDRAKKVQRKTSILSAISMGLMFYAMMLFYAAAFYFGGYLRWNKIEEGG